MIPELEKEFIDHKHHPNTLEILKKISTLPDVYQLKVMIMIDKLMEKFKNNPNAINIKINQVLRKFQK